MMTEIRGKSEVVNFSKTAVFVTACVFSLMMVLFLPIETSAQKKMSKKEQKEVNNVKQLSSKASKAFREIIEIKEKSIPERLMRDAKAIAVFPGVVKAAFIFGGRGGKGLVSRKLQSGWSAPAVYKFGGGSAGFQIGASSTDVILLFMTEDSLNSLLQDKFEIGGEAAVAAGPIGRSAEAATDAQLDAQILSYSKSKGLFAGVSVAGAVISADDDANKAVYGLPAKELLTGVNKVAIADIPDATKLFQQTITNVAGK